MAVFTFDRVLQDAGDGIKERWVSSDRTVDIWRLASQGMTYYTVEVGSTGIYMTGMHGRPDKTRIELNGVHRGFSPDDLIGLVEEFRQLAKEIDSFDFEREGV